MSGIRHVMDFEWSLEQLLHPEGQLLAQRDILLTPDDHRGSGDFVRHPFGLPTIANALAKERAIIVDRRGDRIWIAERGAKVREVVVAEGGFLNCAIAQGALEHRKVARTQHRLGNTRELEKQNVPTAQHLAWIVEQVVAKLL